MNVSDVERKSLLGVCIGIVFIDVFVEVVLMNLKHTIKKEKFGYYPSAEDVYPECKGCPIFEDGFRSEDMCLECDCWWE